MVSPMIGPIDLSNYLNSSIEEVAVGGESGVGVRPCNYDWVLSIREQCVKADVPFRFHQTGAYFIKDGKMYRVPRKHQITQALKANIDYKIGEYFIPINSPFYNKEVKE